MMNFKILIKKMLVGAVLTSATLSAEAQAALKVGEVCPEIIINSLNNKKVLKPEKKAILIDFWATWCSPCLNSFPLLDSIQNKYENNLSIFSVTDEEDSIVSKVLDKVLKGKRGNITIVTSDSILRKFFPHSTLPHYIWIDSNRVIKAITGKEEITSKNIERLINNEALNLKIKGTTITYDFKRPMYASKQAIIKDELVYHSMIAKYRADLKTVSSRGNNYITCLNSPIIRLFQIAFGKFDLQYLNVNKVIVEGLKNAADSAEIGMFSTDNLYNLWSKSKEKNAFSYELLVPENVFTNDQLFEIMQQDLNRYFYSKGISAKLEKRMRKVIALTYISNQRLSPIVSSVKSSYYSSSNFLELINQPIAFFFSQLEPYLKESGAVIVNETGYNGKVNLELIMAVGNLETINKSLYKYGLKLIEKTQLTDVIVISKKWSNGV